MEFVLVSSSSSPTHFLYSPTHSFPPLPSSLFYCMGDLAASQRRRGGRGKKGAKRNCGLGESFVGCRIQHRSKRPIFGKPQSWAAISLTGRKEETPPPPPRSILRINLDQCRELGLCTSWAFSSLLGGGRSPSMGISRKKRNQKRTMWRVSVHRAPCREYLVSSLLSPICNFPRLFPFCPINECHSGNSPPPPLSMSCCLHLGRRRRPQSLF